MKSRKGTQPGLVKISIVKGTVALILFLGYGVYHITIFSSEILVVHVVTIRQIIKILQMQTAVFSIGFTTINVIAIAVSVIIVTVTVTAIAIVI